jgi:hypothetical protein
MKKEKKRKLPMPDITYTVEKVRYLFYKGRKIGYGRLSKILGYDAFAWRDKLRNLDRAGHDFSGIMGAPVRNPETAIATAKELFPSLKGEWEVVPRFKVKKNDVYAMDLGFDYKAGTYRLSDESGFPTRITAFIAAENQYNELKAASSNGRTEKPIAKVSLILHDKKGNVVKSITNYGKIKPLSA